MDRKRFFSLTVALWLAVSFGPLDVLADRIDRIVAVVNGEIITSSELQKAIDRTRPELSGPAGPGLGRTDPTDPNVLGRLIDQKLQLQLARKRGITVEPDEIRMAIADVKRRNQIPSDAALDRVLENENSSLLQYTKEVQDQIMILKIINREVKASVVLSDADIRSYYREHPDRFMSPERFHLRQIILPVPRPEMTETVYQTALGVVAQLEGGAHFDGMVEKYSAETGVSDSGDLGRIRKDHMLPEIRTAVEDLRPGEVSRPVKTSAGVHIFRLEEVTPAQPRALDEVENEIRSILFQERVADLYEKWLKDLRATAQVEIKF